MSTIEELREEVERLYNEHNEVFHAWMDAELALTNAINEEALVQHQAARARKYAFLTVVGVIGAVALSHLALF